MTMPNNLGSMKQSKSFSNDDRDIINQTMEIIKEKQTAERYDQIYNNTKKLLGGNLSELDKVTTIGEIVRTLEECENTGSDFVAFTDILYKHLAPKDNNQNDPIYSEPNLHNRRNDDEEENAFSRDDNQMGLDHIYAEPNSVQQPLLTNEYASPIDRSDQANLYTEPVPNIIGRLEREHWRKKQGLLIAVSFLFIHRQTTSHNQSVCHSNKPRYNTARFVSV